jgi:sortase A
MEYNTIMKSIRAKAVSGAGALLVLVGLTITIATIWDSTIGNNLNAAEQHKLSKDIFEREILISNSDESESNMTVAESEIIDGSNGLKYGEVFAKLYVPRFGADYVRIIAEGTSSGVLEKAMGHYVSTALPWQEGNFAIAAHRTTRGASLKDIDKLVIGDKVLVETTDSYYIYKYVNTVIVTPDDGSVLFDSPPSFKGEKGAGILTMTSCHPKYSDDKRIIAFNELIGTYSKKDYTLEEAINMVR